jgi:hypothetical protein
MEMADQNALIPAATAKLNRGKGCPKAVRTIVIIIARMLGHPGRASVNAVIRVAASVIRGDGREIHFTPEWTIKRL